MDEIHMVHNLPLVTVKCYARRGLFSFSRLDGSRYTKVQCSEWISSQKDNTV